MTNLLNLNENLYKYRAKDDAQLKFYVYQNHDSFRSFFLDSDGVFSGLGNIEVCHSQIAG